MGQKGNGLTVIIVALLVAILGIGWFVYSINKSKEVKSASSSVASSPKISSSTLYKTLAPATVPSKTLECIQPITYSTNGVPSPVQCSNGYLNVTEWKALAALEPSVLGLGYSPSVSQVQNALCMDVKANISNPIEEKVYSIASLYYDWHLNPNPESVILNGTCHNVDD